MIPKTIYLSVGVVEVEEGSSSLITQEVVKVLTDYYTDKIGQYLVAEQPGAGHLQLSSRPGRRVEAFTHQQLVSGLISVSLSVKAENVLLLFLFAAITSL